VSVYLSGQVRDELHAAQAELDRHTESSANARCPACDEVGPCSQRLAALRVFGRYGYYLPRRLPGASRPDLVNAARPRRARDLLW